MKKLTALVFAFAMMLSMVFVSGAISSDSSFAAAAQTMTVKRKSKGIARRSYAGGKWVVKKTWKGGKYVTRKVWVGSKWTAKKVWKGGRMVTSRTKKIIY